MLSKGEVFKAARYSVSPRRGKEKEAEEGRPHNNFENERGYFFLQSVLLMTFLCVPVRPPEAAQVLPAIALLFVPPTSSRPSL